MLKILIIDDEVAAGNILTLLLEKHVSIPKEIRYCMSAEEGLQVLADFNPSLVMLDIDMPVMNGFDFLNHASNTNFDVIFTTAYDKYAIKAIRFSALDYLLKPIDIVDLKNAVNRHVINTQFQDSPRKILVSNLISNLHNGGKAPFKLAISVKEGVFLFELKNIICLEGLNNYTKFFLDNQKPLLVSKTIKEYDEILSGHDFLRVHKSFLVNKVHVKKVDKEGMLHLSGDVKIPISRRRKADVMELFR